MVRLFNLWIEILHCCGNDIKMTHLYSFKLNFRRFCPCWNQDVGQWILTIVLSCSSDATVEPLGCHDPQRHGLHYGGQFMHGASYWSSQLHGARSIQSTRPGSSQPDGGCSSDGTGSPAAPSGIHGPSPRPSARSDDALYLYEQLLSVYYRTMSWYGKAELQHCSVETEGPRAQCCHGHTQCVW